LNYSVKIGFPFQVAARTYFGHDLKIKDTLHFIGISLAR